MIRDPVFVGAHSVARDSISKGRTPQFTNVSRDVNIGGRNLCTYWLPPGQGQM